MKKITFLLLFVILYSCKQENESFSMYGILNDEFVTSREILKIQIEENLTSKKLINNESAKTYDDLTSEYLNYLDKTYSEIINNPEIKKPDNYHGEFSKKEYINDFFILKDNYNKKGIEFISKMEKYRTEILKLIKDKNLAKRAKETLNTMYIRNHEGMKINYLNYYYQDRPLISVLAHMKHRENSIIEMENDFLKNILINENN